MANASFWIIQLPGWLLFLYLVVALCTAAFSYSLGVKMGTQEPATQITKIGAAMFWGFAFADLIFYTPLLGVGLIGHYLDSDWAPLLLGAASVGWVVPRMRGFTHHFSQKAVGWAFCPPLPNPTACRHMPGAPPVLT